MSDTTETTEQTAGNVPSTEAQEPRYSPPFMKVSGQDYVRVADRVVWFRHEHPDGEIYTELLEHEVGKYAVVKAVVRNTRGGCATGYGSETKEDFRDYLEKAEAKALGRALGNLGYGTASALYDDGADHGRVVDAPVGRGNFVAGSGQGNQQNANLGNRDRPATDRQREFIVNLGKDVHLSAKSLDQEIAALYGSKLEDISAGDASAFINILKERKATGWQADPGAQSQATPEPPEAEDPSARQYPGGASLSKMPWPDLVTELLLDEPVANQVAYWKNELSIIGTEDTPDEAKENIKVMCALAGDAVRLNGPSQAWRFTILINAIPIESVALIDSVVKIAERVGVGDNKGVQDAAAGRIQHA